ncbi:MAG: hypothetical protein RLZZ11_937 [Cyanobacteriota bacterium]
MRQLRRGQQTLFAAMAIAGLIAPARSEPVNLASDWPTAQELLGLPDWLQLQLSSTAEPLFNPLGGERSTGSWIQQNTLSLDLGSGLSKPSSSWQEGDHWQLNLTINQDVGDATYNAAIGALFPLQQVAYPAGFYLSEASIERNQGSGWLSVKAGILPINPDFVEVPVLDNYVHSAFNNTLNILDLDLPINPYAALGGVITAHASSDVSLRYGLFDLSSTDSLSSWLGLPEGTLGPSKGTAQFLQLTVEPNAMASKPLPACRTDRGIVRWRRKDSPCPEPVTVQNQLPGGLLSLGGFLTTEDGNGVYGSLTLPSGLPLGLDQRFWIGASYSPDASLDISPTFVGGGLVIQGPLPSRPLDVVVLGIGRGGLSNQLTTSPYEGMLELGYRIQFNRSLNLQPTLQWIFNPSGAATAVPGILAAGMQLQLSF